MSKGPVTLTRQQWNAIWVQAKQIRNSGGDIDLVQEALRDVGLDRSADRISRELSEVFDAARVIIEVLIEAEDAMPDEANEQMEARS